MRLNRLKLKKIGSLFQSKNGNDIVSLNIDENDNKYYVLENIFGTKYRQYYAWEVKWQDICDFFNNKDNSKLIPKLPKIRKSGQIPAKAALIHKINLFDGEILESFAPDETFLTQSLFNDSDGQNEWFCLDYLEIKNFIENEQTL